MAQLPYIVSVIALLFSVYQFVKHTEKEDTGQITTVIVKLENIAEGISEIKADIRNVKEDVQTLRERIVAVEASAKSAHKRMDTLENMHPQLKVKREEREE